jgi:phage-related protein
VQVERSLYRVGSSLDDLCAFPNEVVDVMGYALHLAQQGGRHVDVKPLKGFAGSSVLEIVANYDGNTWRVIYTVRYKDVIYVLHAFQKKSKRGIKTPMQALKLST